MLRAGSIAWVLFFCALGAEVNATPPSMIVAEAVICLDVRDLNPVGAGEVFPLGTPQLYCFTRVVDAEPPTTVTHVWYHGRREMARITLPIAYSTWRTYSTITLYENWPGKWSVAVVSPTNEILRVLSFTIETAEPR